MKIGRTSSRKHRKVYEHHYGKIPKDEYGRSCQIHHIDGNWNNNNIDNLKCVSILEHYNIHYEQKDWGACSKLAGMMKMSSEEISELTRKQQKILIENGTFKGFGHGQLSPNFDFSIYCFENIKTKIRINSLRSDFIKKFDLNKNSVKDLINGKIKILLDTWILITLDSDGKEIRSNENYEYSHDSNIYTFKNKKTDQVEISNRKDFIKKFNLNPGHISGLISNRNKSVKNWIIV